VADPRALEEGRPAGKFTDRSEKSRRRRTAQRTPRNRPTQKETKGGKKYIKGPKRGDRRTRKHTAVGKAPWKKGPDPTQKKQRKGSLRPKHRSPVLKAVGLVGDAGVNGGKRPRESPLDGPENAVNNRWISPVKVNDRGSARLRVTTGGHGKKSVKQEKKTQKNTEHKNF